MDTSMLHVTVRTNELGVREALNYEWRGKSPYIRLSGNLIEDDVAITQKRDLVFGPYRLKFVEYYRAEDIGLYVRADKLGALRVTLYRLTRLLDLIYRRCIITLAVWGLAKYSQVSIPSWRDIYIFKRFVK
jgi:hypothetical protein